MMKRGFIVLMKGRRRKKGERGDSQLGVDSIFPDDRSVELREISDGLSIEGSDSHLVCKEESRRRLASVSDGGSREKRETQLTEDVDKA